MAVPNLIPVPGTIDPLTSPIPKYNPYSTLWWTSSYIDRVPETAVGWLVAQGWQVVDSYAEEGCGQTFYIMARQSMNSWSILQTLLNEYTQAYNEGRYANNTRYNNIINLWNETIHHSREQMDVQGDVSDGHISLFVTQIDAMLTGMEEQMATAETDMETASAAVTSQLATYLPKVTTPETDYSTHAATATAFLTGLGTTELARINEHYDNLLSTTRQQLVNRGLYSSAVYTQMQVRIERERNEAIAKLNDQLNREKWENQHRLFQQQQGMRQQVLEGYRQYMIMQIQNGTFMTDSRRQIALATMQARLAKAQARMDIRDREDKLMAYQLDTRNNLIVGLFGFMERREDVYPSMESITKLVVGLGDAGGGWVTP